MLSSGYGELVKRYRKERGMSQETLAYRASLSTATVSKLERGISNPKTDTVESLFVALGIPYEDKFD